MRYVLIPAALGFELITQIECWRHSNIREFSDIILKKIGPVITSYLRYRLYLLASQGWAMGMSIHEPSLQPCH